MNNNIIFYSWQSDLPNSENRNFIKDCIEKAVKDANRNDKCLEVDRDTCGMAGFPNIEQTILRKIQKANVFVADISIINDGFWKKKRTPNPNVLFELGYAVKTLGWERIICVFNNDYGKIEDLPFDIKQHRVVSYSLRKNGKKDEKKRIANIINESLNILAQKGLIFSKNRPNENYLLEGSFDDIFYSSFVDGASARAYMNSVEVAEFYIRQSCHGNWEIIGVCEKIGYNFINDFLHKIDYEKSKVQITCIDLDGDGNKEIFVSIGDGLVEMETNVYRFIPESKHVFELCGRILGQQKMRINLEERQIIAPYGSQGLSEEYMYIKGRLWRPAPEVENKLFA